MLIVFLILSRFVYIGMGYLLAKITAKTTKFETKLMIIVFLTIGVAAQVISYFIGDIMKMTICSILIPIEIYVSWLLIKKYNKDKTFY
jgi:hypothetical protein